jgi:hypothetical protein
LRHATGDPVRVFNDRAVSVRRAVTGARPGASSHRGVAQAPGRENANAVTAGALTDLGGPRRSTIAWWK